MHELKLCQTDKQRREERKSRKGEIKVEGKGDVERRGRDKEGGGERERER